MEPYSTCINLSLSRLVRQIKVNKDQYSKRLFLDQILEEGVNKKVVEKKIFKGLMII